MCLIRAKWVFLRWPCQGESRRFNPFEWAFEVCTRRRSGGQRQELSEVLKNASVAMTKALSETSVFNSQPILSALKRPYFIDSAQPALVSWRRLCSHLLSTLRFSSDRQEELEFRWQFILGVKSVREIDSTNTAVGVDLNSTKWIEWVIVTEFEACYEFE